MTKKILISLTAALGLTMSAHANMLETKEAQWGPWFNRPYSKWNRNVIFYWLINETFLSIQMGDGEAYDFQLWDDAESTTGWTLALLGYGGTKGENNIFMRRMAYVEAARVKLGGRPLYTFNPLMFASGRPVLAVD